MIRTAACLLAASVIGPAALATIVAPGGAVLTPPGQAVSFGTLFAPSIVSPLVTPTFTGTLISSVYTADPQNTLGGLTFHYQIINSGNSVNAIGRLTVNDYTGFITDMTWQAGGTVAPISLNRPVADQIGFNFAGFLPGFRAILPSDSSMILVVHTDAPLAQVTIASVIDGFTANVPAYAPLPTPGAGALLGAGLLAAARRRRS